MSLLIISEAWGAHQFSIFSLDQVAVPVWYIPSNNPSPPTSGSYVIERTGTKVSTADACNSLAAGTLTGKVALIRRGTCTFSTKIINAANAGAVAAIVYNNGPGGLVTITTTDTTIPGVFISAEDGEMIDTRLGTGPVILTWTDMETPVLANVTSTSANGTYGLGSTVDVTLHFNEAVSSSGLLIALDTGVNLHTPEIVSKSIISTSYTVQENENSKDLTVAYITGLATNASGVVTFNPQIPVGKNLGDAKNIAIDSLLLPKIVTPSTTGKGTLLPATQQSIPHGTAATFTVKPDSGYSAKIGGTCGGALEGTIYTTNVVIADCTVIAEFNSFSWPLFLPAITLSPDKVPSLERDKSL